VYEDFHTPTPFLDMFVSTAMEHLYFVQAAEGIAGRMLVTEQGPLVRVVTIILLVLV